MQRAHLFTAIAASCLVSCTVANPLDYLQSDRGKGEGAGEGCARSSWSECGVTEIASGGRPYAISASTWAIYYSDSEVGSIYEFHCPNASCETPKEVVSGENPPPLHLANESSFVYWATETQVRGILLSATAPDAFIVHIGDTVNGPTGIGSYAWSDSAGIRGTYNHSFPEIVQHWSEPTTFFAGFAFISGNEVHVCAPQYPSKTCSGTAQTIAGGTGAQLLTNVSGLAEIFTGITGLVASLRRDGESEIVHLSKPEDASTYTVLARDSAPIVALAAWENEIYFTTEDGRLRRWRKESAEVETLIRGLSGNTVLSPLKAQVFVIDRDQKLLLRVVP